MHIKRFIAYLNTDARTLLRRVAGIFFITIGIIGLFLPFLQGVLFISLGAVLLGQKNVFYKLKIFFNTALNYFSNLFK